MHDDDDSRSVPPSEGWPLLPELQPGDEVGDFVVERFHAAGGWSDVYVARHREQQLGPVAIKIVPLGLHAPVACEPLEGIPHLVRVFATGAARERGFGWVAMQLVEGEPLDALLGAEPDPTLRRAIVERCAEVAEALAAMHRLGFVHGDVKPANILVERGARSRWAGAACLVDLGCARPGGAVPPAATIRATLPYAAPELLLGLDVDGRADVFALGLCLHDLLSGRAPSTRARRPAAGLEPLAELVPGCDADLAAIVAEAVEPSPAQRYRDADAFASDLRAWLDGRAPSVRPRGWWRRLQRNRRKQPARFFRATTIAAVLIALGVGAAFAVVDLAQHVATRRGALLAVERGDLAAALRASDRLHAPWSLLGLASPIDGVARADREFAAVVDELRAARIDEAHARAARVLARDGVEAHERLAAWLLWRARDTGGDGRRVAAVLSYVLWEHPLRDLHGPAARSLRAELRRIASQAADDRGLHAFAALGGATPVDEVDALATAWIATLDRHPARIEAIRLGIEVLHRISARCRAGEAPRACAAVEAAWRTVVAWLAAQEDLAAWRDAVETPLDAWLVTLRRIHDSAGPARPERFAPSLPWPATVAEAAIAGDVSGLHAEVASAPFADPYRLGFAVGVLDGEPRTAAFRAGADVRARARAPRWQLHYAAGRRHGRGVLAPLEDHPVVRARGEVEARGEFAPAELVLASAIGDLPVASWSFVVAPPCAAGSARSLAVRAVRRGVDEVELDSHLVSLVVPGESAVRLEFDEPKALRAELELVLSVQRGQRGALPYGGTAAVDILLDRRPVASLRDVGASVGEFRVRLPSMEVARTRELELRLADDANTTLRLFAVRVE